MATPSGAQDPMRALDADSAFLRYQRRRRPADLAATFDATASELLRVAVHLVPSLAEAEDLVQETFLVAMDEHAAYVPGGAGVLAWLLGILRHRALRQRKKSGRKLDAARVLGNARRDADPVEAAQGRELEAEVRDAIERMPPAYRDVLRLHLADGLSTTEIALALDRPPATVRTQLSRGLARLRERLPAGLAGSVVMFSTERGLAAVRSLVLEQARASAPIALSVAGLGLSLGFVMKKTLLTLGLLVAVAALGWAILEASGAGAIHPTDAGAATMAAEHGSTAASTGESEPPATQADAPRQLLAVDVASGIALLVTDARGLPIAGAHARTFDDSIAGEAITDAEGKCALAATPGEGNMRLWIDAPGLHHVRSKQARRARLRVSMFPTTTLVGTVLDEPTGEPIAHARVALVHDSCDDCAPTERSADAEGHYEMDGVPVGPHVLLRVDAAGHPPQKLAFQFDTVAPRTRQDLRIERGMEVSGIVVDFTTGAPVAGVAISDRGRTSLEVARTDAEGAFRAELLPSPAGIHAIRLEATGYCIMDLRLSREELQRGTPVSIPYPRVVRFTGTVQDETGHVLAGAEVSTESEQVLDQRDRRPSPFDRLPSSWATQLYGTNPTKTDAEGRFSGLGLVPWSPCRLWLNHPACQYAKMTIDDVGAPGESLERTLTLASFGPTGTVSGVVTANGAPAEADVYWRGPTRDGGIQIRNGRYRGERVEAGSVRIDVVSGELGVLPGDARRVVTVRAGEEVTCDFALTVESRPISGHVARADGTPCVGAGVSAGAYHDATTDRNGDYSIEMPANARPHAVTVGFHGVFQSRPNVSPGTTGLDFTLPLTGRLRYRVVDRETGRPLRSFEASWVNAAKEPVTGDLGATENEGWMTHDVPPGRYEGMVIAPWAGETGYLQDQPASVEIRAAETTDIELPLGPGALFRGRLAEGEQPVPEDCSLLLVEADAWDAAEMSSRSARWREGAPHPAVRLTDRQVIFFRGHAEIRALRPGRYRFKVFGAALAIEPEYVDVAAGVNPELALRWRAK